MRKKVAVLTPFGTGNFGTILQAFATQTLIRQNGCDCSIINYAYKALQNPFPISNLFRKGPIEYASAIAGYCLRLPSRRKLLQFISRHMTLTEKVSYDQLKKLAERFDQILVGSDCVWLGATHPLDPAYLLDFVDDDTKKGNFASSFATDHVAEHTKSLYRTYLSRFPKLSVREKQGQIMIQELADRDSTLVLDPTLTMDHVFWGKIAEESKLDIREKYILVAEYAISTPLMRDAELYAKKHHVKIYSLYPPKGKIIHAKFFPSVSPADFVYLIRHAELILTDSYHSMIFSINFGRNFYAYQTATNLPTTCKFDNILSLLHLEGRFLSMEEQNRSTDLVLNQPPVDYEGVNPILEQMRTVSKDYLRDVLS